MVCNDTTTFLKHFMSSHIASLARANKGEIYPARFKTCAEDFLVSENLSFEPTGSGEHAYLRIRKIDLNTVNVASELAKHANVRERDVSYAGLKDRNAIAEQWFSIHLPGIADPDWRTLESENLSVLQDIRHNKKLRRGAIKSNHFVITLRDVQGEKQAIEQALQFIGTNGVPNYFGEQRFGSNEGNIKKAKDMLSGKIRVRSRHQRSLYLSAARSMLFNLVLSRRVELGNWNQVIAGDAMMLSGSNSYFVIDQENDEVQKRLEAFDIHPTGPLWGKGNNPAQGDAKLIEQQILSDEPVLCTGLERAGMEQQRRALRLMIDNLQFEWQGPDVLRLELSLQSGTYATSVLRECFAW